MAQFLFISLAQCPRLPAEKFASFCERLTEFLLLAHDTSQHQAALWDCTTPTSCESAGRLMINPRFYHIFFPPPPPLPSCLGNWAEIGSVGSGRTWQKELPCLGELLFLMVYVTDCLVMRPFYTLQCSLEVWLMRACSSWKTRGRLHHACWRKLNQPLSYHYSMLYYCN